MSGPRLTVLMSGVTAGHVTRPTGRSGPWVFTYDDTYADGPAAVPLSLSMPLKQRRFADARVRGWMAGLLPGHSRVLRHWAAKHGAASIEPIERTGPRHRGVLRRARLQLADLQPRRPRQELQHPPGTPHGTLRAAV